MELAVFLPLILAVGYAKAFHVVGRPPERVSIVGGTYTTISEVPYQASLLQDGFIICGATIVSEYWLVSAAHCFLGGSKKYSIRTGSSLRLTGGQMHKIEKYILHKNYDTQSNDNDIALVKLERPIRFNKYQKEIGIAKDPPKIGDVMKISGYGREGRRDEGSPLVKVAYVKVVSQRICEFKYIEDPITSNAFCAGRGDHDTCQGDSGGPGIINGKLAGVVSSGAECGSRYYPGIYTRVDKYYDWITKTIGKKT